MVDGVSIRLWRNLTRALRAIAFLPWALAAIDLARHGDLEGQLWWPVFLVVYGLVLVAELGRAAAERRERERSSAQVDAASA